MKFAVRIEISVEAGAALESAPGGPGPVMMRFVERFKPEALYLGTTERTVFGVIDFESEADITEFMVFASHLSGSHAEMTPVMTMEQFGGVAGGAIAGAQKLLKG